MQGYRVTFNLYAESEHEAKEAEAAIIGFINNHALNGRAVTASKVAYAVRRWDSNPVIKREIIKYFSDAR